MDHQLDPGIDGADASMPSSGTPVDMAATNPHHRPDLPDDSGDYGTASPLPASLKLVESNSRHGVYPEVWYGDLWYYIQR
jgi:hypothetical protein